MGENYKVAGEADVKKVTVIQFRWPTDHSQEGICLLVPRTVDGRKQCAILHRSDANRNYAAVFPFLANLVRLELYTTANLSAIAWLDAEFAVDLGNRIHYGLSIVTLAKSDGTEIAPARKVLSDPEFIDWGRFLEPTIRFALSLRVL